MFRKISVLYKIGNQSIIRALKPTFNVAAVRNYAALKRFYKNTDVIYSDGKFEITLDHKKLKTPNGQVLTLKSEPLAIAIASEWDMQKNVINRSQMHLTALCFTAQDNPYNLQKPDLVNHILNVAQTDTVLYQSNHEKDLFELQTKEWDPVIKWFNERFETNLEKTLKLTPQTISLEDKMKISRYLMSHDADALHGFVFAVDTLKSVILAFASVEQLLEADRAVHLSRLEEEYQIGFWGRVEWAHDVCQQELQERLSAAVLFIHFNRSNYLKKDKLLR